MNIKKRKDIIKFIPLIFVLSCSSNKFVSTDSVLTKPVDTKIFLEKPYINKSWNSTGGNNKNTIGHIAGKKDYKKSFSKDIGSISETKKILYTPVANENTIFTMDGNLKITATDTNSGEKLWQIKDLSNNDLIKYGSLNLTNDSLYAITNNSQLIKINPKTGEILYSIHFNTKLRSGLSFCNDKLFFISDTNELYIIKAENGEKLYTHKTMEETSSFIKGSTPACFNDNIIATFSNGEVHSINSENLTPVWLSSVYKINKANINNISDIVANPVIKNNYLIIKGYNDITKLFDITNGKTLWDNSNGGLTTPTVSNDTIFDINNNNVISATNLKDGKSEWETKLNIEKGDLTFSPLLINNQLIVPVSNGNIININPYTGDVITTQKLTSEIDVSPIVIEDKLIIISNGNLEVFN